MRDLWGPTTADGRRRDFVSAKRVVWQEGVPNAEALLRPDSGGVTLRNNGTPIAVLLDFGCELHGGVIIENGLPENHSPVRVRIRFGESATEAMGQPDQDHAIHDSEVLIPWYGSAEFGNTGFRFVRIDLLDEGRDFPLKRVQAVSLTRDLEYKGAFSCSDTRLNQIWRTGAYAVHLCMQDMLWDGIKRDRLVWIGDMHPETMIINSVFGENEVVPKSLDYVRDSTPLPNWMNGISSYSMWWVLIHHAWYLYHGNERYLEEQREYLIGLLRQFMSRIDENHAEKMDGHRFLDWPTSEDPGAIHAGLQALLTMTLRAGAELCHVLEETDLQHECQATAMNLLLHKPSPTPRKAANALMALAGMADARDTNRSILAQNPVRDISTFYGYYVLQARALADDYQGALDVIRTYWGAMLDRGATTFWEHFELDWLDGSGRIDELPQTGMKDLHADYGDYCYVGLRHSLCHGWAGGPTAWLSEHVLGFRPLEPGCERILLDPHLCDLQFAEGAFPTPAGIVKVRHELKNGRIHSDIDAPKGIRIIRP